MTQRNFLQNYQEDKNKKPGNDSSYAVTVRRKGSNYYFFKAYPQPVAASEDDIRGENFISHLIRMIISREPVTDIIFDDATDVSPCGLISDEVKGFKAFGSFNYLYLIFLLLSGRITGLGEISAIWLIVAEADGKAAGNIGINCKYETIKLDNGEAHLAKYHWDIEKRYPIKNKDINNLPLPPSFVKDKGTIWFYNNTENFFQFVLWLLSWKKEIRLGINSASLKFILLPAEFIQHAIKFLTRHSFAQTKHFDQIMRRIEDTKKSALNSKSFRRYVVGYQADKDIENFFDSLDRYELPGKIKLAELSPGYKDKVRQEFQSLKKAAHAYSDSYSLIVKIGFPIVLLLLGALVIHLLKQNVDDRTSIFNTRFSP